MFSYQSFMKVYQNLESFRKLNKNRACSVIMQDFEQNTGKLFEILMHVTHQSVMKLRYKLKHERFVIVYVSYQSLMKSN